jgi:hypothetical protein
MSDTTTLDPQTLATTIDTYLDAYGETDAVRRDALIAEVWAADGRLADPPFEGVGHDGISALSDVVFEHFPGHTFRRTTGIDAHHGVARYGWDLVGPDGAVAVGGVDIAEIGDDGRLVRVTGFFGDLPALDA